MRKFNSRLAFSLIPGLVAIIFLVFLKPMKDNTDTVFSTDRLPLLLEQKIHFKDISETSGLDFDHRKNSTGDSAYLGYVFPSVAVYDFDKNGFVDIFYSGGQRNYLYLNMGKDSFIEAAKDFGLEGNEDGVNSQIVIADLNNDGEDDVYLAKAGKHKLYFKEKNKNNFLDVSDKLQGYQSYSHGINFIDFNQDGLLDILVGNFVELGTEYRKMVWYMPRKYDQANGGWNHLLIQNKNGTFSVNNKIDFLTRSFTHSVGISDVNLDGFPDVFFANDYGKDQMFVNLKGKQVVDVTQEYIPKQWHGNSGMNAEFVDYDRDGLIDLYVSNSHKPPFNRNYNILWKKKNSGNGFDPVSWNMNVGRCGFSWAAQFADFNLDGELDLFVVNGKDRDPRLKNMNEGKSFWYERMQLTSMPFFMIDKMREFGRDPSKMFYNSGFERDCLFIQHEKNFYDVAAHIGLTDTQEGRGMAVADFNNDGLMDIVVTNFNGKAKVYMNTSETEGSWIGFHLKNKNGSQIPIGARTKLLLSDGTILVDEYYPANGFRAQSDNRLHYGMKRGVTPVSLEVLWPGSTASKKYVRIEPSRYNEIQE